MVDVYLWLYHIDLWPEFYDLLSPIKNRIVLHLGLCEETSLASNIETDVKNNFPSFQINYHKNVGGDILPFLSDFANNMNKQSFFIKIHSKKSKLMSKIEWRHVLLHSLLGNGGKNFDYNYTYMTKYNKIGLISHANLLLNNKEFLNFSKINEILQYYEWPKPPINKRKFAAGTMFMARSDLYHKFINTQSLSYLKPRLETEKGYVIDYKEGKYCHSIERIFGYISQYNGYKIASTKYPNIRIINTKSTTKKLHLSMAYDNFVFLEEDLSVHGRLLQRDANSFTIEWHHLSESTIRNYKKLNNRSYIGH